MRLASYRLDGEDTYGAVVGDGVVTLGGRNARYPTLRDALTADAIGELRSAAIGKAPDHKLAQITFLPLIPNPEKDSLRRHQLSRPRGGDRPRHHVEPADVPAARQYAGRA